MKTVDWFTSTRASLLVVGLVLAALAITTLTNDQLAGLPLPNIVAAATGAGAAAGLYGAFSGASPAARRYTGAALMIVSVLRAYGLAAIVAGRTDGFIDFLKHSNVLAVWTLGFYFGFLVWARADAPEYRKVRLVHRRDH